MVNLTALALQSCLTSEFPSPTHAKLLPDEQKVQKMGVRNHLLHLEGHQMSSSSPTHTANPGLYPDPWMPASTHPRPAERSMLRELLTSSPRCKGFPQFSAKGLSFYLSLFLSLYFASSLLLVRSEPSLICWKIYSEAFSCPPTQKHRLHKSGKPPSLPPGPWISEFGGSHSNASAIASRVNTQSI